MRQYYRIILGRSHADVMDAVQGGYIGVGWMGDTSLGTDIPTDRPTFNQRYKPLLRSTYPGRSKISIGLACGALYTVVAGLHEGDVVITTTGSGQYYIGEISGPYVYVPDSPLEHRRPVVWRKQALKKEDLSGALQRSISSMATVADISKYAQEIEQILGGDSVGYVSTEGLVEDVAAFALEKQLEDFLVANWQHTDLGKQYDILHDEDGDMVGQQFQTDTGPLDILAISKDKSTLLVIELKRGRASDVVVGQVQRYMGYVQAELAEADQSVRGAIIAFEHDSRIQRALSVAQHIDFYTYTVQFSLHSVYTSS